MNFKKMVLLFCVFLALLYICPVFANTIPNDISGHWAENTILKWQKENKIKGYTDGTFRPNQTITRAEFVQLLYSVFPSDAPFLSSFSDVKKQDWYYDAVVSAAGSHIVNGFEDNTFRPHENITRAQAAVMLFHALGLSQNTEAADKLTDADRLPLWAKGAIGAMVALGYLYGYEDGSFLAEKHLTRAEALSMLDRISFPNKNSYEDTISYEDTAFYEKEKPNMVWERAEGHSNQQQSRPSYKTITSETAADYSGKTIYDAVKIEMDENDVILEDVIFYGDVAVVSAPDHTKTNILPILKLKGTTTIHKSIAISTPVTIEAEKNQIAAVNAKAQTVWEGEADISYLQTNAALFVGEQTWIDTVEILPGAATDITMEGSINYITANGNGSIERISLTGNTQPDVTVPKNITVKAFLLSEKAQPSITVEKYGEIQQIISFAAIGNTNVFNRGSIQSILALHPETISSDNAAVFPLVLKSISIEAQPNTLHYQQGEQLSLEGICLLLTYQNHITKIIDSPEEFSNYFITTSPSQKEALLSKHDNCPIVVQSGSIVAFTEPLTVQHEPTANTIPLQQLISQCRTALSSVVISQTGAELSAGEKWVTKEVFLTFENAVKTAENALSNVSVQEIEKQYTLLTKALHTFQSQIQITEEWIEAPILSISNTSPEYGAEDVTVTIQNQKEDVAYYYTLNGTDPNPEDTVNTKLYENPIVLSPPKETEQTSIVIKAVGKKGKLFSEITEQTVTYSAPYFIEKATLSQLQTPMVGEHPSDMLYCEQTEPYFVDTKPIWEDAQNNILNEYDIFQPDTVYKAHFSLKSKKPFAFKEDTAVSIQADGIKEIIIDPQHSNAENLFVLVSFEPTPPLPTQQQADEILEEMTNYVLFSPIEMNQNDFQEDNAEQIILSAIAQFVPSYWEAGIEIDSIHTFSQMVIISAKFTVQSQLDPSITAAHQNNIDITISWIV